MALQFVDLHFDELYFGVQKGVGTFLLLIIQSHLVALCLCVFLAPVAVFNQPLKALIRVSLVIDVLCEVGNRLVRISGLNSKQYLLQGVIRLSSVVQFRPI